jgi:hypothetical protein
MGRAAPNGFGEMATGLKCRILGETAAAGAASKRCRGVSTLLGGGSVTCRAVADFINEYLSGELAPEVRHEFDRHLELCRNCRRYLALYNNTVELGRRAFADDDEAADAAGVPQELIEAILAARLR